MTFLVNEKMHPDLAARIEASVTGNRRAAGGLRPRTVALARITLFVAMALFVYVMVVLSSQRAQLRAPAAPKAPPPRSSATR